MKAFLIPSGVMLALAPIAAAARPMADAQRADISANDARKLADCAISRRPDDVRRVLTAADAREFKTDMATIGETLDRCAESVDAYDQSMMFGFRNPGIIGVLAEAWIRRKGAPVLEDAPYRPGTSSLAWATDEPGRLMVFHMAACLAATRPAATASLVRSIPGAQEEAAAASALAGMMPACLEKNVTLTTSRAELRFALAGALYRRAFPPVAAAVAGSNGSTARTEKIG